MHGFTQQFDLAYLEDGQHLTHLLEQEYNSPIVSVSKIGQGFYGHVYGAYLKTDPERVIIKCYLYAGHGVKETQQLKILRAHAIAKVPQVYALHLPSAEFPCEALLMEYIPGINASKVEFPDEHVKDRFVDAVVENLAAWHAVSHLEGFGELNGPFCAAWTDCFQARVAKYHDCVHLDRHKSVVSDYVMSVIDRSYEALELIFQDADRPPSLVHGDYNAWNMMVDPATLELTGIIDPIDAGWADFEIDLFHLSNCRPDLGLLERYLQDVEVDEGFWLRFRFYRFWDDVKHYLRVGWYEEQHFRGWAEKLENSMNSCLV